jgi:hypothetical protein
MGRLSLKTRLLLRQMQTGGRGMAKNRWKHRLKTMAYLKSRERVRRSSRLFGRPHRWQRLHGAVH